MYKQKIQIKNKFFQITQTNENLKSSPSPFDKKVLQPKNQNKQKEREPQPQQQQQQPQPPLQQPPKPIEKQPEVGNKVARKYNLPFDCFRVLSISNKGV